MPEALGESSAYLALPMMWPASLPVSMSGAMSLVCFHTLSSGKGRSFTMIQVIVASDDTIFLAR